MLSGAPDRSLDLTRLEREVQSYRREITARPDWFFRERYIDRGVLDPYYILQFRDRIDDAGDDLYDQDLFVTPYAHLRGICMTREKQGAGYNYWRAISRADLDYRLERFMKMYREDHLQPPGAKGDLYDPQYQHELFKKKRFLFEIRSESKSIIGVGPKMYAGVADIGAVCGQLIDEQGEPLDGAEIQLFDDEGIRSRTTGSGGLFWFSKVPQGKYTLRVKERTCIIQILRQETFGNIKGWLTDQDGHPVEYADLNFRAPDGAVFSATSDDTGKFTTGPLPAFPVTDSPLSNYPYIMQIPGFMFSVTKSIVVKDAVIGGTLRNNNGVAIANATVLLKQGSLKISETNTDAWGNFRFFELAGGKYEIEVPGEKIYLSQSSAGRIEGKEAAGMINETRIELVAEGKVAATERLNTGREFGFDDVAPGKYTVRSN